LFSIQRRRVKSFKTIEEPDETSKNARTYGRPASLSYRA
jgi:hypothetical protein